MPYVILSDLHCHNWSLFAKTNSDGVNSRLQIILNEIERAAKELVKVNGRTMIIPGDIFHVRGSIDPEVLNPTQDTFRRVLDMDIDIHTIPGNHDLKSKDTTRLGSSIETLANTESKFANKGRFKVHYSPEVVTLTGGQVVAFVPWRNSKQDLLDDLAKIKSATLNAHDQIDVFIHAGIDGVIPGLPAHGLTDVELASFGFRRVYAGDYHNHKVMQGGAVVSVGASTHQTWGDIGSKAGFIIASEDGSFRFMDTHAPKFIDVSGRDEDEIKLLCDGNYIRFRGNQMTSEDIQDLKDLFESCGALGTSIQSPIAQTSVRTGAAPVQTGQTLDQSVGGFVDKMEVLPTIDREKVKREAADVLKTVRSNYEEA